MGRLRPWEVVSAEELADCAVFSVARVRTRSPISGRLIPIYRIAAEPWVNVVPITSANEVVMVRQWRHGSRELTLEIPGGIVDPGEKPEEAAARELLEETGFRASRVIPLGSLNPNPALFSNRVHTFLAPGVQRVAGPSNPGEEETVVECVPASELAARVQRGEIDHALVVAALYWWEHSGSRQP